MDDRFRYKLVEASIAGYPKFHVSDIEFSLPQPTYTIDTLRALERLYPEREFHFIMGADNWTLINRWKESETIIANYPILIYPRRGYEVKLDNSMPHIRYVEAPQIEISSTFIRQSLRAGRDIRFSCRKLSAKYYKTNNLIFKTSPICFSALLHLTVLRYNRQNHYP